MATLAVILPDRLLDLIREPASLPPGLRPGQVFAVWACIATALETVPSAAVTMETITTSARIGNMTAQRAVALLRRLELLTVTEEPTTVRTPTGRSIRCVRYVYAMCSPGDIAISSRTHVSECLPTDPEPDTQGTDSREDLEAERAALIERLVSLGVDEAIGRRLLQVHGPGKIADWLDAARDYRLRNPAGWLVSALARGWALPWRTLERRAKEARAAVAAREEEETRTATAAQEAKVRAERERMRRVEESLSRLAESERSRVLEQAHTACRRAYGPLPVVPKALVLAQVALLLDGTRAATV